MITIEQRSEIRRLFYVKHFSANAIASTLGIHRDTVLRALELKKTERDQSASELDRFTAKIKETLELYPKLHGSHIHMMLKEQGYTGSLRHLRRKLQSLRRPLKERFYVKSEYLPGECAQVDWGHFGTLKVGKAERKLSAFVMTLAWSRRMFVYFTFDQKVETLLDCHRKASLALGGVPRSILYDNMKTVVAERVGSQVRYHEALIEFRQHWLFQPSVCAPYQPQSKGRVERSIRYFRGNLFEARAISDIRTLNMQALDWCESESKMRNWPEDPSKKVSAAFIEEQKVLLPLPEMSPVLPRKHSLKADRYGYVHFDRNFYSVPGDAASVQLTLEFLESRKNLILAGAQGLGKTMIARNLGHYAVMNGYTCLFTTASALAIDLGAQESQHALQRRLKHYESRDLLIIDEIGYLSFDCRAADFIFEIVNRRYEKSAICISTNLAFKDWTQVFPGAPCVNAMVDRLTHHVKIIKIAGESHRLRETKAKKERA